MIQDGFLPGVKFVGSDITFVMFRDENISSISLPSGPIGPPKLGMTIEISSIKRSIRVFCLDFRVQDIEI